MAFWVYAENPNPAGFQGHSPWIRLYTTDRDYFEIRANREVMNDARNQWYEVVVPFQTRDGWSVHRVGNPDLSLIRRLEISADTWDHQPYRYWLDGLRFNLPTHDVSGLVAYAGNNRVSIAWQQTHYSNFLRYEVYRASYPFSSIAGMTPIAQISSRAATRYVDTAVVNGQSYYYAVAVRLTNGQASESVRSVGPRTPYDETDLQVVSIARTPRYPRYDPIYDEFTITEPSTGFGPYTVTFARRLGSGQTDSTQRFPRNGDRVTYTAYVRNRGTSPFYGDATLQWRVNGSLVAEQRVYLALQPSEMRSFSYTRVWDTTDPEIRFTLTSPADQRPANNSLAIHAKSVPFLAFVDRTYLEEFRERSRRDTRATTDDFIDWLNHHMRHFNRMFADAGSPKRVHYDVIQVLEDDQPDPDLGNERHHFAKFPFHMPRFRAGDGYLRDPQYTAYYEPQRDIDKGLLHEFGHELGLIDLYRLNVDSHQNLVNGRSYREIPCLMNLVEGYLSPHSATAMTRWYDVAHGYYGQYLYDLPEQMRLQILDRNGAPLAGAQIRVYQLAKRPGYDAPVITNQVKFQGSTDANGYYTLPNVPIDPTIAPPVHTGNRLRPNPFGYVSVIGWNGLFLIRIDSGNQTDWVWLSIVEANLAYWSGRTGTAIFIRRTTLPPSPTLESVTLNPSTVIGGNSSTGTVTISAPAPAGGLQVQLSSGNTNVATVPASVTIPAGQRTTTFTINTRSVCSPAQVSITARLGNSSRQATLTVNPRPVEIASVEVFAPNPVVDDDGRRFPVAGRPVSIRITLREPASCRTEVRLRSSHPSILGTPERVYFEQGQRTVELTLNTNRIHQNTDVTVTASHGASQRSGQIRLYNTVICDVRLNPSSVRAGDSFVVTITMAEHIPNGGYRIRIQHNGGGIVNLPPDVQVPGGRRPPLIEIAATTRRGSVSRETDITITFHGGNGEVFRRLIRVRP